MDDDQLPMTGLAYLELHLEESGGGQLAHKVVGLSWHRRRLLAPRLALRPARTWHEVVTEALPG